ncbi:hypothetical protein NDU88_004741, partial [Pleurodeles waltl]
PTVRSIETLEGTNLLTLTQNGIDIEGERYLDPEKRACRISEYCRRGRQCFVSFELANGGFLWILLIA